MLMKSPPLEKGETEINPHSCTKTQLSYAESLELSQEGLIIYLQR